MNNELSPVLVVLAAGLGSRYGGLKQLDAIGIGNETIMDLSICDAIQAGFKKIVLIINKVMSDQVQKQIVQKYQQEIFIECAFQELELIPSEFKLPPKREKPWGTAHAILSAKKQVSCPFAVINADDFYGPSAFQQMRDELVTLVSHKADFCMLGYRLSNTLSTHGGVSRGLCSVSGDYLSSIKEFINIREKESKITGDFNGEVQTLSADSIVSMNFWGFTPKVFELLEERFRVFLQKNLENPTAEFFITDALDYAIHNGLGQVKVLTTTERWFGVTFREDRDEVREGIRGYLKTKQTTL